MINNNDLSIEEIIALNGSSECLESDPSMAIALLRGKNVQIDQMLVEYAAQNEIPLSELDLRNIHFGEAQTSKPTHLLGIDEYINPILHNINFAESNLSMQILDNFILDSSDFSDATLRHVSAVNTNWINCNIRNADITGLVVNDDDFVDIEEKKIIVNPKKSTDGYFCALFDHDFDDQNKFQKKKYPITFISNEQEIEGYAILAEEPTTEYKHKLAIYFVDNFNFNPEEYNPEKWSRIWKNSFYTVRNTNKDLRKYIIDKIKADSDGEKPYENITVNLDDSKPIHFSLIRPIGWEYK